MRVPEGKMATITACVCRKSLHLRNEKVGIVYGGILKRKRVTVTITGIFKGRGIIRIDSSKQFNSSTKDIRLQDIVKIEAIK